MDKNICNICKIRAYIQCDLCDSGVFFCSRGHLNSHKIKIHNALQNISTNISITNKNNTNDKSSYKDQNFSTNSDPQIDLRKLFEIMQNLKNEIEMKISKRNYVDAILTIRKCLGISNKFYEEDHLFNLELVFRLAESNINISNLEEGINTLEKIISITENSKQTSSIISFRYRTFMLIGAVSINIGDFSKALKSYTIAEGEITKYLTEPELNVKLASIYLNLGICYIHMNNPNLAEKLFKKGLIQTEGMLGNEIIHKLQADLNENMGIFNEMNNNPKEALNYYKKSLKTKFHLFGENNDEVLDLQYKIASSYISLKQFKEAEEIMMAMTEVVSKEKLIGNERTIIDNYYRYGVYFYTTGVLLLKSNRNQIAKEHLSKANVMWKDIVNPSDPGLMSIRNILKICDKKI